MIIEITLNTGQYTLYNRPLQHEQLTPPKNRRTDIISNEQHLAKIDWLGTDTHCGWVNKANLTCTPPLPPQKKHNKTTTTKPQNAIPFCLSRPYVIKQKHKMRYLHSAATSRTTTKFKKKKTRHKILKAGFKYNRNYRKLAIRVVKLLW